MDPFWTGLLANRREENDNHQWQTANDHDSFFWVNYCHVDWEERHDDIEYIHAFMYTYIYTMYRIHAYIIEWLSLMFTPKHGNVKWWFFIGWSFQQKMISEKESWRILTFLDTFLWRIQISDIYFRNPTFPSFSNIERCVYETFCSPKIPWLFLPYPQSINVGVGVRGFT